MDNREKTLDDFFRRNDNVKKKRNTPVKQPESEQKIEAYLKAVAPEKPPKRQSRLDKVVEFFKITTRKNHLDQIKTQEENLKYANEGHNRLSVFFFKVRQFFISRFSFENGVDILDETSVLFRKNWVMRNILWVTNLVFLLFTLIGTEGTDRKVNLIVSFAFFLVMFFTNQTIRKIITQEPQTLHKQQLGEYISGFYILMMAVAVYIKLRLTLGNDPAEGFFSITQAGYSLIYFALVVLVLYQDPKLLGLIFKITIIVMTIIHLTILYPVHEYATSFVTMWHYIRGPILTDLILRTLVLAVFMIGLYSTALISDDMNNKRKAELIKRRQMEKDFKAVVSDVFDVISVYKHRNDEKIEKIQRGAGKRIAEMAAKLGHFLGYSPKLCQEIFDFSTIHIDKRDFLSLSDYDQKEVLDEADFKRIREKTIIGSIIIKRLQLEKKGEDIVRAHFEKTADPDFTKEMNAIQNNRESQVILIAQIYDILRQNRNYKRDLKHARAIDLIQLEFYPYFDPQIVDRFVKYSDDFEAIYYRLAQE